MQLTPDQMNEVNRKIALLIMARGCKFPEYIAKYSIEDRKVILSALDSIGEVPLGETVKILLIINPELVSGLIQDKPQVKSLLNLSALHASEVIKTWDMEQVEKDIKRYLYQSNPGKNAQYN